MTTITVHNLARKRIRAILTRGRATGKLAILCHGFGGDKNEHGRFPRLARKLARYADTLRFDFTGSGESDPECTSLAKQAADLTAVLRWAHTKKYRHIAVVGLSFGGLAAVLAYQPCVKALVLWAPALDPAYEARDLFPKWEQALLCKFSSIPVPTASGIRCVDTAFFNEAKRIHVPAALKNIKCPTLILHGDKDDVVPIAISKRNLKHMKHGTLRAIPGADHDFAPIEETVEFLKAHFPVSTPARNSLP